MADWQPIESAPKDGTRFVATGHDFGNPENARHLVIAYYDLGEWCDDADENTTLTYLTHWIAPPQEADLTGKPAKVDA